MTTYNFFCDFVVGLLQIRIHESMKYSEKPCFRPKKCASMALAIGMHTLHSIAIITIRTLRSLHNVNEIGFKSSTHLS